MKILYVTDLHGDKNKYRKSLEIAMKQEIRVIVNGGDMLPKLGERHTEQPLFIKGFLSNYFSIWKWKNRKDDHVSGKSKESGYSSIYCIG